jgi:hypothetical protein
VNCKQATPEYGAIAPILSGAVLSEKMKKKEKTPNGVKVFTVLFMIGVIASVIDGVVYQFYVRSHGLNLFGVVPMGVLWSYNFPQRVRHTFESEN